jgi:filamentous hemagglutinin family protein
MLNIKHACKYSISIPQEQLESAQKIVIQEFTGHNESQVDGNIDVQNHSNKKNYFIYLGNS